MLCKSHHTIIDVLMFQVWPGHCWLCCVAGDPDVILRCIVSGFFANAARIHHSGSYRWELGSTITVIFFSPSTLKWSLKVIHTISNQISHRSLFLSLSQDFTRRPWASHPPQLCAVRREASKVVSSFSMCKWQPSVVNKEYRSINIISFGYFHYVSYVFLISLLHYKMILLSDMDYLLVMMLQYLWWVILFVEWSYYTNTVSQAWCLPWRSFTNDSHS